MDPEKCELSLLRVGIKMSHGTSDYCDLSQNEPYLPWSWKMLGMDNLLLSVEKVFIFLKDSTAEERISTC